MRFASWNVKGLNKGPHQKLLVNFISLYKLDLMGVLETKVSLIMFFFVFKKIQKNWKWLFNYEHHYNGHVWVGWNPNVWDITLHSMSSQHITCLAKFLEKDYSFLVSFLYAHNDALDRNSLCQDIASIGCTSFPWCLLGDFNYMVNLFKVSGGREHWTPDMQAFKDRITSNGLGHVRTVGDLFTWTRQHID